MESKNCPFCGKEILSTAKKCKHCKKWLEEDTIINQTNRMIECSICGEQIEEGLKICPHCNEPLGEDDECEDDNKCEENNTVPRRKSFAGWIFLCILGVISLFGTLPFHYVLKDGKGYDPQTGQTYTIKNADFRVFPKEHFTFSNTFVVQNDIDNIIKRYNNANLFEQQAIRQEPLAKKLIEKKIIGSVDDGNNGDFGHGLHERTKQLDDNTSQTNNQNNSNTFGIWEIRNFVDDFGEPTKERHITTKKTISGKYSIFSSNNVDMQVYIAIVSKEKIAIQFKDWSGSLISKGGYTISYKVLVQDSESERYTLSASNYNSGYNSDWLYFSYSEAKIMYNILLKGGTIKFKIYSDDLLNHEYSFTIDNANGLENAYNKLIGSNNALKSNLITPTSIAGIEVIDKTVKDVKPYFDKDLIWEYVDNYEEMYLVKKGRTVVFEFYTERKVIVGASVLDPTFVTADGFHVGSTSGDILKKYPKATVYSTEYDGELTEINGIAYFYANEPVSNIDEDFAEGEILNKNVKITSIGIRGNR